MKRDFSRRSDPTPGSEPSASMEALCELFSTLVLLLLLVPFVLGGRLRTVVGLRRRAEPS